MTLVLALRTSDDAETVDACVSFHLNAGVGLVLAADEGSTDGTLEVLAAYEREGAVRILDSGSTRTDAARAASELSAEWVLHADADEFLWPRGADLEEVLGAIPARYEVVRALARTFPGRAVKGTFAERRMLRLATPDEMRAGSTRPLLRVVHRALPRIVVDADAGGVSGGLVPLRSWYPIEVLRFPGLHPVEDGGERPGTVEDTRLRDVLRALLLDGEGARRYALPSELGRPVELPYPSIVDDALYAAEVAAVGETDLATLRERLDELEEEIARLERGFWRRVERRLARLRAGARR